MKKFTFRWLKRFYILFAVKLVLLAVLLTSARILFIGVDGYKEQAIDWLTSEYKIDISVQDISAGIDFSGMILTLNNVELLDSEDLPFVLTLNHLFLHLDFWDSVTEQKLNFNSISLQGAVLTVKEVDGQSTSEKSQLTINRLKDIFLTQLKKVSIKGSTLNFTDQLGLEKSIVIEQLRWLNEGDNHQGIGQATLTNTMGKNSLKFVVDLFPETDKKPLSGNLYLHADNLNITDYLIKQVNTNAEMLEAVVGFEAWAQFSTDKIDSVQVQLKESSFAWSQLKSYHSWALNSGLVQLTNGDNGWLLDSYDLDISRNQIQRNQLNISGQGDKKSILVDVDGLTIKDVIPFYLLYSDLSSEQITALRQYDIDGNIDQIGVSRDKTDDLQFSLKVSELKNRPVGGIPGVSNAKVTLQGDLKQGHANIRLAKQKIYFDGQFSRTMPVKSGDISLQWAQSKTGFTISSDQTLLTTNELDSISEFSLFLPNEQAQNQSAFLSLYSYASLNDASKAQYYFPMKAMGDSVFKYLEPTIKQGQVKGAKILWYGAFNQYPYLENNGIFQAWIPLRDAKYDFYGQWQGLTDLDLDLLFENDYLLMDAKKATLGKVKLDKLSAKVDHLNPDGILTIKADINEDAQKISDYLKTSPLGESVGKALSVIQVSQPLSGNITLTVPFNREKLQTKTEGQVYLNNNDINIELADNFSLPLKQVNGSFSFVNGNLTANDMSAQLFEQPLVIAFSTLEKKKSYQVNADINGIWKLAKLSAFQKKLQPLRLSGHLDWSGKVDFKHQYTGGYQFDVALHSAMQGIRTKLPAPFYKNSLHSWPTAINISGNDNSSRLQLSIKDKLRLDSQLNYTAGKQTVPYFHLNIGPSPVAEIDKTKQVIDVNLETLNVASWYDYWLIEQQKLAEQSDDGNDSDELDKNLSVEELQESTPLIALDEINVDIKHLDLFNQPLTIFSANAQQIDNRWEAKIASDKLQTSIEYRPGIPLRVDINATKVDFQELDISLIKDKAQPQSIKNMPSDNLRIDYPEVFIDCKTCIYKEIDLSPLSVHIFPTKKRLNLDYIKVGEGNEYTDISGFWDQRVTNIIVDSEADKEESLVQRFGFTSPVYHQSAQLSGAFNWVGAPWQANLNSLNGAFSAVLKDGAITEVSDNGARLLSVFSLDGIRRSLNLEFDNVFAKGFKFDELTFSANINDGVLSNDDFYLDGSAGKITGSGLVDLPNQNTNYKFSYSPAVTSSLPVLAAFAINPLTGAAVLMLTKILEPVVDTIIRVDFSVKGDLTNPDVKLVTRERGKIKLENSEVLQEMSEQQQEFQGRQHAQ
ncbi:YhdP family protein [Psychromonas sp. Urea-02u-13]|uniref:YhdP family protein n=1 Tax=Psychromonas sp. Urea-02u-13 TaxID=2058326 RepID=UPI000C330981|nr:YhdP family protein [Psychromonas sp. Urea-02u-13]PKG39651.1 TIGR02099 family protein [Psychromonas sp. Urea-02u-13]